jgi:hypothetical protein
VKILKKKWKYLRDHFQKESRKVVKPKFGAARQETATISSWKHYKMMLFFKDLPNSEKS